ncbi:MAG: polysaccharide biosynthesis tyrosine autokinase [Verrucomicrobiota bacterium]
MSGAPSKAPYPATPTGTSLVDRMNLSIHLRKYVKLFTRRFWIILLCVIGAGGYSYYKAKNTPDEFEAYSVLGVTTRVVRVTQSAVQETPFVEDQLNYMRGLVGKVGEQLSNYRTATKAKPKLISATPNKGGGSSFTLTVRSDDFEYARLFAERWASEFLKFKDSLRGDALSVGLKEARAEEQKYRTMYERTLEEKNDFLKKHEIGDVKESREAQQALLDKLFAEYTTLKTERELVERMSAEEFGKDLENRQTPAPKGDKPEQRPPSPRVETSPDDIPAVSSYTLDQLRFRKLQVEEELAKAQATLKEKHPHMARLREELAGFDRDIRLTQKLMDENNRKIAELKLQAVSNRIARLDLERRQEVELRRKREEALAKAVEEQRALLGQAREIEYRYQTLVERADLEKKELDRWTQARMLYSAERPDEDIITIMQSGVGNPGPVFPNRSKMITQGLLYGLGLGLAIVFLLHRLDDRLELAEDIEEELEEPVLGQVPQIDATDLKDGRLLITHMDQHNMFAESIRGVRSAVMFGKHGGHKQVILVTSAVPGDGKTTFTANFAATLAGAGNRVLLVDADLRRGNIHHFFGQERDNGLSEVLAGELNWSDAVHPTEIKNLDVVSTGRLPSNPGELLIGPVTAEFIKEAREEYDHILFDCPPLTAIDDTFCLVNLSDGLLFIVKAGQTSMRFAKNALANVQQRGAEVIGIVLNGITTDHPSYYYNYYYHAYYNKELNAAGEPTQSKAPAVKMAPRKRRVPSIDQEAHARAGQPASSSIIAAEEQKKAELFKARRAQKSGDTSRVAKPDEPANEATDVRTESTEPVPPKQPGSVS